MCVGVDGGGGEGVCGRGGGGLGEAVANSVKFQLHPRWESVCINTMLWENSADDKKIFFQKKGFKILWRQLARNIKSCFLGKKMKKKKKNFKMSSAESFTLRAKC